MNRLLLVTLVLLGTVSVRAQTSAWINEFHYDDAGADVGEFVEVVLPAGVDPSLYTVYLYNGNGGGVYSPSTALSSCAAGSLVDANGDSVNDFAFYSCSIPGIQNGAPDGIALAGPDPLNPAYPLVQFLSYEGTFTATDGVAQGIESRNVGVAEAGEPEGQSLQLTGSGLAYESFTWVGPAAESPGSPNAGQTLAPPAPTAVSVTFGAGAQDVAGVRQLAVPVGGLRVNDLAQMNLVQGVPGQAPFAAQYPTADPNLFTAYVAPGYVAPASTAQGLQLGRGYFWALYDQNISPPPTVAGGGTSQSYELPKTDMFVGYTLDGDGTAAVDYVLTYATNTTDGFYLVGNPIDQAFALTGLSVLTGATGVQIQSVVQVYNPATGSYESLTPATDGLAVGQGAWVEVTGVTAPNVALAFDADAVAGSATFYGRRSSTPRVALRLEGTLGHGTDATTVRDEAAAIHYLEGATAGWDIHDGSKLTPPAEPWALVSIVGERAGASHRQAVRSLPMGGGEESMALSFASTEAGTFDLSVAEAPEGWAVLLTDAVTGVQTDLATGTYTFDSDASDWSNRFSLTVAPAAVAGEPEGGEAWALSEAYPNPAAASARLALRVEQGQRVTATVYDGLGRQVASVFDGDVAPAAALSLVVPTESLAPGVYVVRVEGEAFVATRRLVVVR